MTLAAVFDATPAREKHRPRRAVDDREARHFSSFSS
jgi:hypothetical protein